VTIRDEGEEETTWRRGLSGLIKDEVRGKQRAEQNIGADRRKLDVGGGARRREA